MGLFRIPKQLPAFFKTKKFLVALFLFLLYKSIFNVLLANALVPQVFSQISTGKFAGNFTCFSLFFGIEVENLSLTEQNATKPLFQTKRLALRYNLPWLFLGKLKVSDLALEETEIALLERDGVWNFETLFPPREKTDEPEPEPEPKEPLDRIKTYLPIAVEAHVLVRDLSLSIQSSKLGSLELLHLFFQTDLVTNRFTEIPFQPVFLQEVDRLHLSLNPEDRFRIVWKHPDGRFDEILPSRVLLDWNLAEASPDLKLQVGLGSKSLQLLYKNKVLEPGLEFQIASQFHPEEDRFDLQAVRLEILGDVWLEFQAKVNHVTQPKETRVAGEMQRSRINLQKLSQFLSQVPELASLPKLGGSLSLQGTRVSGTLSDFLFQLVLAIDGVQVSGKTPLAITRGNLDLGASLDLTTKEAPTATQPIPLLRSLNIQTFSLFTNVAKLGLAGFVRPSEIALKLLVQDLELGKWTTAASGGLQAELSISGQGWDKIQILSQNQITRLRYSLDRSRSPDSMLQANATAFLFFRGPFQLEKLKVTSLELLQSTMDRKKALALQLELALTLGESLQILIPKISLQTHLSHLLRTLPLVLREKMLSLPGTLGDEPSLTGEIRLVSAKDNLDLEGKLLGKIPGLQIADLISEFSLQKKPKSLAIRKFTIGAFQKVFSVEASGLLEEKKDQGTPPLGPYFGKLGLKLGLNASQLSYLTKGISFQGALQLALQIQDFDITGSLQSKDTVFATKQGECPGTNCKIWLVDKLQASIPIHHNLAWKKEGSMIVGDKSPFIKNRIQGVQPNFSIFQIVGSHTSVENLPMSFVKNQGDLPGFSARIEYKENFASIDGLKIFTLDGMVLGNDLLFYLGAGRPESMECRGNIQIRDIDLKQLMAPKVRDKIDDGKLKADLNLEVRDFTDPVANLDLFFSIFRIGKDFGKSALNVISPQNFLMDRITDSYSVSKIEVSLSKGLVYADVFFRRSLLSFVVNLEDNKISQERMPLASFLKRAQSEIETYQ